MKEMNSIHNVVTRVATTLLLTLLTATTTWAQTKYYITDVKLIGGTAEEVASQWTTDQAAGWSRIEQDLNAGCTKGTPSVIYLLYKTGTDITKAITDFYIDTEHHNNDQGGVPGFFGYHMHKYEITPYAGGEQFISVKGDLNSGVSGSNDIHLYYTKATLTPFAHVITGITFNATKTDALGANGGTTGYDLNANTQGGDNIYMHLTKFYVDGWVEVLNEDELNAAVTADNDKILVGRDIALSSYLNINGKTLTIDLNGHKLYRNISGNHASDGHVIYVHNTANLTLNNSTRGGSVEGGKAKNGGAIFIEPGSIVEANDVAFRDNSASEHAGAIWNSGTLTATNCIFTNNSAYDVGAVYNAAVESTYFGTATFTSCTFTGNSSTSSGGALANATGSTSMTLDGCTITDNTAAKAGAIWNGGTITATNCIFTNNSANDVGAVYNSVVQSSYGTATFTSCTFTDNSSTISGGALANATGNTSMTLNSCTVTGNTAGTNGGGIWNGGTLTITGNTSIIDNDCAKGYNGGGIYHLNGTLNMSGSPVVSGNGSDNSRNNLYLCPGKVINVTGAFTSGAEIWLTNAPGNFYFTSGYYSNHPDSNPNNVFFYDDEDFLLTLLEGEVIRYEIVLSQDATYRKEDGTMATQLGCHKVSIMSDYTGVVMENGWYVVDTNKTFEHRITIVGTVHLILTDGTKLDAKEGIRVPSECTLHVWGQSWPDVNTMGNLNADARTTNGYAGIGGNGADTSGPMFFHGGNTLARGSQQKGYGGAGIGGGYSGTNKLITISGGAVSGYAVSGTGETTGTGAGIGSGSSGMCMGVTITGGMVVAIAVGGAGIGSGYNGFLHEPRGNYSPVPEEIIYAITISGGIVIADSGLGAGIGGGSTNGEEWQGLPGHTYIDGGQIRASTQGGSGLYESQAIGHGTLNGSYTTAVFDKRLYEGAKVQVSKYISGSNWTTLSAKERMSANDGPLQLGNTYKRVYIDPCNHPDGLPCRYCGRSSRESLSLADASNNYSTLQSHEAYTVDATLSGRTLWKDGSWNTLCLPFDTELTDDLAGATLMELDTKNKYVENNSQFTVDNTNGTCQTGLAADGTLYLFFKNATSIEAGKPYIIKWTTTGDPIVNPTFSNVKITNVPLSTTSADGTVQFKGTFSPLLLENGDKSNLFLGSENTLYWPNVDNYNVNAFRAYFHLNLDDANAVRAYRLNFGGNDATPIDNAQLAFDNEAGVWYDVAGRRLNGAPTAKGIYIVKGRKVIIK